MKKPFVITLTVILLLLVVVFYYSFGIKSEKGRIYNDNPALAQDGDTYTYLNRVGETDNGKIDISYSKFSGSDTIWIIQAKKQTEIKFEYTSEVSKGKFKAVLITPSKEVINMFEGDGQGGCTFAGPEGKYLFKLAGDNASGKVDINILENNDIRVTVASKNT